MRTHRFLVPTLITVAAVVWFAAAFSVWVNRQALNTDNWTKTSGKLLANKKVDTALGAYLVNQLFTNVDVQGALQQRLPAQLQPLAGPVAGGLRQVADQAAPRLLANPSVQAAWITANRTAHKELVRIVEGGGPAVSTANGNVVLNLRTVVDQLAKNLGVEDQVAAARSKLQSGAGAKARGVAQQKLGVTLPPNTGQLVIMRSKQLKTAQDVADGIRHLALWLPILALVLYGLAIFLARGWRRVALRSTGWSFVIVGLLLLLIRRIVGNQIVNSLVKVPSNKPAVHDVWNIATALLYSIAVALLVYGILIVASAWLAGATRSATAVRRSLAPTLRDHPGMAYGSVGAVLLLVVAWGPTPAFRQLAWVALFTALLALAVTMLRRQTAIEFAGAQKGDTMRGAREGWSARRSGAARAPEPTPESTEAERLNDLERLTQLHDRGVLSDDEFAEKTNVLNGS